MDPSTTATDSPGHGERDTPDPPRLRRRFSSPEVHPYDELDWERRSASIQDESGRTIFEQRHIEVPAAFSDLATKILASKYFYGDRELGDDPARGGRETSFKQVVDRVAGTLARRGREAGYFRDAEEAQTFEGELTWLLVRQHGAFNSPVWFNLGLREAYGTGRDAGPGNYFWDAEQERVEPARDGYEHPQCSACFIQSVDDTMDSIMELARSEALLFKYGSGSGTDLSPLRSTREKLSGGGQPSGPLSFLSVYDAVAGTVKSGGKTRRAAKMNTLHDRHPDIEAFIEAKEREERKARALIEQGYDPSFNGEAYASVKFQNENLSVRASDAFMEAAVRGEHYFTRNVTDGSPCEEKDASRLLDRIAESAHVCGDPGMQFDDTIHAWHPCKGSGRQNSTNPCGEYLFLDDSACNLASLNLMAFRSADGFDAEAFAAAARVFVIAQDILVDHASYPTDRIAHNTHRFRALGLGYANLGALLMAEGLPYDSDEGRGLAAAISAILTGAAYRASAELAERQGPFPGYRDARHANVPRPPAADNVAPMREVLERHRRHVDGLSGKAPERLAAFAAQVWDEALEAGERHGYRNAQATALAPTGTIGFLMDCDTTGIEPAIGLVAYKTLAGGGLVTLPIRTVPLALRRLGYDEGAVERAEAHLRRNGTLEPAGEGDGRSESGVRDEHLPIFDTAFHSGAGSRALSSEAHLDMMAAVQPFISGAISKTVNMPSDASIHDIREIYVRAWRSGVKGIAVYRDGSKRSAPIRTRRDETPEEQRSGEVRMVTEPYRRKLPDTRSSITHKFSLGGNEGYLTVGKFDDGRPGEAFIQMAKAGSTVNGLTDSIGILVSLCLQHGVPLETLVKKFSHVRFEPEGMTNNPDIPFAKSVVDYVGRFLGMEFVPGYRERMSPAASGESPGGEARTAAAKSGRDRSQLDFLNETEGAWVCPECGSGNVKITGSCACCLNCGASLGCS